MGISIDLWRARIGGFNSGQSFKVCKVHAIFSNTMKVAFFAAALLACLVIGNIELNPGPVRYNCPVTSCDFSAASIESCAYHQQMHKVEKNFFYRCPMVLCRNKVFSSYSGLLNHIKEAHPKKDSDLPNSSTAVRTCSCQLSPDCSFVPETRSGLCQHYLQHVQKNIVLKCPWCLKSNNFSDDTKFASHVRECHFGKPIKTFKCCASGCNVLLSCFDSVCDHYCAHLAKNIKFTCPLQKGCCNVTKFSEIQLFRSHLSVKHPGWKEGNEPVDVSFSVPYTQVQEGFGQSSYQSFHMDDNMDCEETAESEATEDPITAKMFFNHIAHFYFMMLAEHMLPDSTVDAIAKGLKLVSELIQHQFSVALTRELKKVKIKEEEIVDIINQVMACDVFYAAHHKESPGPTFTSVHLRSNFMKSEFQYVTPVEVSLDKDKIDGAIAHLVPPEDVLKLLLQDVTVQNHIQESFVKQSDPNVIQDYSDGSACRSECGQERIDIMIFQDTCNLGNPLGSAKNKYKFNGTYWTIGNLPPHVRSEVDCIYLAYLVNNKYLADTAHYGPKKCFQPIVERFKKLETDGIQFMGRVVPVRVQYCSGDSLGAHEIGGFIGMFSSTYFCRFCEIQMNCFHRNPSSVRPFRTKASYKEALRQLEGIRTKNPRTVTFRGVKQDSVLHQLKDFHVCDPRLPPCVAHDIFEKGVADQDLSEIISNFVNEGWLSYVNLNQLISSFTCLGPDKGNKPAPVKEDGMKLGGHAVQNWTLVRLLPFIIQDRIRDPNHPSWQFYLKLKKLVEYACSSEFREEDLAAFKELSIEYMTERQQVLSSKVKPKHHFLMHYADLIPLLGPIIYLFTLRFEAKHQFFKRVVGACRNFINLGFTLAKRHQVWMAYLVAGSVLTKGWRVRKYLPFNADNYEGKVKEILMSGIFDEDTKNCSKIDCDKLKFKVGMYVLLGKCDEDPTHIIVGKVEVILQSNERVVLILNKFRSNLWREYGVYKIDEMSFDTECVPISNLKFPLELPVYSMFDEKCFSLKHFI